MGIASLDRTQKRIIYGAVFIVVLMGVFPPWQAKLPIAAGMKVSRIAHLGYGFIGNPPSTELGYNMCGGEISIGILLMQWLLVSVLTAGLVCLAKDRKEVFSR